MRLRQLPARYAFTLDDQRTIEVERIGQGRFTTAYRAVSDLNLVYLAVNEERGDYSKHILADCDTNPHLPIVRALGELNDRQVYATQYYRPLTASSKQAWQEFKAIAAARETAWAEVIRAQQGKMRVCDCGYLVMARTLELLHGSISDDLYTALAAIQDAAGNYGSSYVYEFAKRNLAVSDDGRLILLDPIFDLATIEREQAEARKRSERRYAYR
jgi:hypothetical protein